METQPILWIMATFMALGAIDRILGNRFGLGEAFEDGFKAMGPLALAMLGVVSATPVLARVLRPIVVPIYQALGADPAIFATTLLACDMGGYTLAQELALTPEAGQYAGILLGTMMGPTVVFSIPVALGLIQAEDRRFLATGMLAGFVTIPMGCVIGGLIAGWPLPFLLINMLPVAIVSLLIALGLWLLPAQMIRGFHWFGKAVVALITLALAAILWESLTGMVIIPGMAPVQEGVATVGSIAIVLAGAFPMVRFITRAFGRPLAALGRTMGMGEVAAAGLVASLANNIPMFAMMKGMDDRGKVLNSAFAVSGAFTFGGHLGFTAGVEPGLILPMIVGKLVAGVSAILLAMVLLKATSRSSTTA